MAIINTFAPTPQGFLLRRRSGCFNSQLSVVGRARAYSASEIIIQTVDHKSHSSLSRKTQRFFNHKWFIFPSPFPRSPFITPLVSYGYWETVPHEEHQISIRAGKCRCHLPRLLNSRAKIVSAIASLPVRRGQVKYSLQRSWRAEWHADLPRLFSRYTVRKGKFRAYVIKSA